MEPQTNFQIDHNAPPPIVPSNSSNDDLFTKNFSSSKGYLQEFHHLDQLPFNAADINIIESVAFDPFDPFLLGSSSGFASGKFNPYEGNDITDAAMRSFEGDELLDSLKTDMLMEIETALDNCHDPKPVNFVVPDEGSSVTSANNIGSHNGGNDIKTSKNSNEKSDMKSNGESDQLFLPKRPTRDRKSSKSIKGQWTPEEDRQLIHLVEKYGVKRWSFIAQMLQGRIGKQCRERWHNHLRPDIKKDLWTEEEDSVLIEAHAQVGNKWAEIAKRLPGRTENSIKNHWNATKRRQLSQRKCRTKWPKPSNILQNYIRSLSGTSGDTNAPTAAPPQSTNPGVISNTSDSAPGQDSSPADHNVTDYDHVEVIDFNFDDGQMFNVTILDSLIDAIPPNVSSHEADKGPRPNVEVPLDASPSMLHVK